jgi:hypothetical protein
MRAKALTVAALSVALAGGLVSAEEDGGNDRIHLAGGVQPAVLALLDLSGGVTAVAFAPDGNQAALASPDPKNEKRTLFRLYTVGQPEPAQMSLPGVVRSLLFARDGVAVFAILYRPAKKRLGDAELLRISVAEMKSKSIMRLPPTSAALDYWAAKDSLLIPSRNEIRTVRVTGLRSGPLYRVPGYNLAIASLAASDVVLIGREDGLMLIDLGDPPGEEAMPVRESVATPGPVVGLAASADGTAALARLPDGQLYDVALEPLSVSEAGSGAAVASLTKGTSRAPIELAPLPEPEPAATTATTGKEAAKPPEPEPSAAAVEERAPPPVVPVDEPAPAAPEPPAETPPPAQTETAPPAEPDWSESEAPQLWGRLTGPESAEVDEVVLLGPNNVLREAARVRPQGGIWQAGGLEPGRYQVQLAAGGKKVLISEPRVALVEISETGSVEAPTFEVLRSVVP